MGASGGSGGIRTHGGVPPTLVFKTRALNHSATLPQSLASDASDESRGQAGWFGPGPLIGQISCPARCDPAGKRRGGAVAGTPGVRAGRAPWCGAALQAHPARGSFLHVPVPCDASPPREVMTWRPAHDFAGGKGTPTRALVVGVAGAFRIGVTLAAPSQGAPCTTLPSVACRALGAARAARKTASGARNGKRHPRPTAGRKSAPIGPVPQESQRAQPAGISAESAAHPSLSGALLVC